MVGRGYPNVLGVVLFCKHLNLVHTHRLFTGAFDKVISLCTAFVGIGGMCGQKDLPLQVPLSMSVIGKSFHVLEAKSFTQSAQHSLDDGLTSHHAAFATSYVHRR